MNQSRVKVKMPSSIRSKLLATLSMLLVATIMMVSTSYAWLVLSTAPEVTGIDTQIGANGSLEIALLNGESFADLSKLDAADFDESAEMTVVNANLTWGNLVSLADTAYGLSEITLMPSRLNIMTEAEQFKVKTTLLKTPKYGEDGRILKLNETALTAVYANGKFTPGEADYGVRAIGTSSNLGDNQLAIMAARNAVSAATAAARTAASNVLNETGGVLGNIVVKYALGSGGGYTKADIEAMKALATGLKGSLAEVETALRTVFAAYIASDQYDPAEDWDYEKALDDISNEPLSTLYTTYGNAGVTGLGEYIDLCTDGQTKVNNAIAQCDTMLESEGPYTWDQIVSTMNPLVQYEKMTLNGKTVNEVKNMEMGDLVTLVSSGGMVITVPSGSGIISDVADFAGDYTANVTVENVSYGETIKNLTVTVTMTTKTEQSPVYLVACSNAMTKMKPRGEGEGGASVITDFFGYAVDLAFRTNASGSTKLLLQVEPENRVYAGETENANLQGGGSYMEYSGSVSGISATKMIKLMRGIRVVFMDSAQTVLAIGALDTTLGQSDYKKLSSEEETATGKQYVLDSGMTPQVSDYITQTEYDALQTDSAVIFDKDNKTIKARLYLYSFEMTKSTVQQEDGTYGNTGGITLTGKIATNEITTLEQDQAKIVTAMVYLDGSFVNNSMVAADSVYSMKGTLNLQFASDALLLPANNSELRSGASESLSESSSETE